MARVPISFYLNILAGIIVIFNHYAASETGDVALNKVTGAAGRFYTLFRDTVLAFQHGCTSRLETVLCGSAVESVFPLDAVVHLRARYCHPPEQDSENIGTSNDWQSHGGYGGSDFAFVWDRTSEAVETIGVLLLRTCVSWWWFRAPLKMTGFLLVAYTALSALGYLFGASVVMRGVFQVCEFVNVHGPLTRVDWQVYTVVEADFLQCIQWEAQRQVLDMGVMMMERAYGFSHMLVNARGGMPGSRCVGF
ncbi:hypothetical protein OG21DRAFT_1005925 [Imleria badia]|nr:hypothetical protein OG21DRAFT_1005925 [Imleria badia]